jgi:prolyl oligopeptidase
MCVHVFVLFQVKDEVYTFNLVKRVLHRIAKDFVGAASLSGKLNHPVLFITMTGFTPGTIAQYDFSAEEQNRWRVIKTMVVHGLRPEDFEVQQVRPWFRALSVDSVLTRHF